MCVFVCGMSVRRTYRFDLSRSTRTESISFVLRAFVSVCLGLLSNEIYAFTISNFISKKISYGLLNRIILLVEKSFFSLLVWLVFIKVLIVRIISKRSVPLQTQLHC